MRTPWAILRIKFNNDSREPFDDAYYRDLFTVSGSGTQNLFDYFRDVSHGNADLTGTQVFNWFTIPHASTEYEEIRNSEGARERLESWIWQAVADIGVRLNDFYGLVACFNARADLYGAGRLVVTDDGGMWPSTLGQEMCHGYGLMTHSRADGSSEDYQDAYDIMSADETWSVRHPRYESIGPLLNAWNMRSLGWLDETRVWRPRENAVDEVVELRPHVRRDLPGWLAAEIPGGYLAELRVREGWDAGIFRAGVQVHRCEAQTSYVMGPRGTDPRDVPVFGAGSAWEIGSASGPRSESHVRVEVQSLDPLNRTARIRVVHRPAELPSVGVFYRGDWDALAWRAYDGGRWHGEEVFGSSHPVPTRVGASDAEAGGPSVVHGWNDHRFAVFFRGADGRLRWKAHHGGRWHGDAAIDGGSPLESHPCVVREGRGSLAAFYRTADNWLAWRFYDGQWHAEQRFDSGSGVPSWTLGVPAAVADWRGNRFALFFRSRARQLHWKAFHGGRWHNEAVVPGGGEMTSDPAVVRFGPERLAVFYRGLDDALVWRAFDGGRWHGEERFNSAHPLRTTMASAPTAVANWAGNLFAVFFRGADGTLRWKAHSGGRWHGDAPVGGGTRLSSSPAIVAFV